MSRTDADARLLTKGGHTVAGYNVQLAVDEKHKLIVASEVVNDGNDSGQLYAMAAAAKAALGVATLTAVADAGYYNGETLKACEADAVTAYVPPAERNQRLAAQGRFGRGDFHYDADTDVYHCPAGERLKPMNGRKQDAAGKLQVRYAARVAACGSCSLRAACLTEKAKLRIVYRWEHEDVVERHLARMRDAGAMMRRRSAVVEHPFGTLKCRAGYRHFLLRGFDKVRGECSLMVLSYNFTRVLSIFGIQGFIASLAK
ncbi:transposase [Bradyrhizobium yuanmingense]|uniref:transposase n=1 Tax=Bradyrhizobium yuanmingense TaxID=108015 RepID=UPI0023B9CC23|nr:transposase [Bradyrhizobium yuanmingense]MDF0523239.1 transposase [Bradyrhizobium yuanmingense]